MLCVCVWASLPRASWPMFTEFDMNVMATEWLPRVVTVSMEHARTSDVGIILAALNLGHRNDRWQYILEKDMQLLLSEVFCKITALLLCEKFLCLWVLRCNQSTIGDRYAKFSMEIELRPHWFGLTGGAALSKLVEVRIIEVLLKSYKMDFTCLFRQYNFIFKLRLDIIK
jgi:hypothetical protein